MLTKENLLIFVRKYKLVIGIFIAWLIIQAAFFYFLGIAHGGDTPRYTEAAKEILNEGIFFSGRAATYLGYNLFLASIFSLRLGELGIVLIQVALTLLAAFCIYKITFKLSNEKTAAFLAVVLYVLSLELHTWNFYILTDSFSISMTVISLYLISHIKKAWQLFYVLPIIALTASIRPMNFVILIAGALFLFSFLWAREKKRIILLMSLIILLSLPLFFSVIDKMASYISFVDTYLKGQIIWSYDGNAISPPENIFIDPNYKKESIAGILSFAWNNFGYMSKLAGLKLYYLFAHIKPFYSTAHNWLIAAYFYPLYILAALGLLKKTREHSAKILLASYCLGQILIVMITYEDWDGRFLQSIMPIILIFSAIGLYRIISMITPKIKTNISYLIP